MKFEPEHWAVAEQVPAGDCAMWWSSPEDPLFQNSTARRDIERAFRALDGFEPDFYASILGDLKLVQDSISIPLPVQADAIPIHGPAGQLVLLVASREKGLKFHFATKHTPPSYRNEFLRAFAEYAEAWHHENGTCPLDWWLLCDEAVTVAEKAGFPATVGNMGCWGNPAKDKVLGTRADAAGPELPGPDSADLGV